MLKKYRKTTENYRKREKLSQQFDCFAINIANVNRFAINIANILTFAMIIAKTQIFAILNSPLLGTF